MTPQNRRPNTLARAILRAGAIPWLAFASITALSSELPDSGARILFQSWGTEDGLPQNHATAIAQTQDGYLWLGTYNGIARFDGLRFTVSNSANTPSLRSSRIITLHRDAAGTLWLGHEGGGLSRFQSGTFESVALPAQWPREPIDGIADDPTGHLWILSRSGTALRVRDGLIVPATRELTSAPVPQLVRDHTGELWRIHEGKFSSLGPRTNVNQLPADSSEFVAYAAPARDGGLWIATSERLWHWASTGTNRVWGKPPWGNSSVTALIESRDGQLWAGTLDRGLYVLAPDGTSTQFTHTNGFPHAWIRCLFEDREGTIWAGTGGGGLSAARERRVTMIYSPDDWQKRTIVSVSPGAGNSLWIGTEGGGVYRWAQDQFAHFDSPSGLQNLFVWSVFEDSRGTAWAGTWGGGMFRQQGGRFDPAPSPLNEPIRTLAIFEARDRSLWIGTQSGLVRLQNGRTERFAADLDQADVRSIAEAVDGTIWFGMAGGGLGRLRAGKAEQFRKSDGLPSDYVWSLHPDQNGDLWIGTFGGGLSRWRHGSFANIGADQGLPNNVICHITEDQCGLLWMSSYGGILRASKVALNRYADGFEKTVAVFTYGKSDGLAVLECTGGSQPSGSRTADGKLWFPTSRGLAMVDPSNLSTNPLAPPVVIEQVSVDLESAEPYRMSGTNLMYRIPPGKQRFEFRYTGLSFIASHRLHFKFRLEPLDDDWVDAGTARTANYSFLEPGEYTFRVIARNNDGVWNESGASIALIVLPYFWQTLSFKFAVALGSALLIGGTARTVTRRRYRRKLEQLERQRAVERERTRIAKDIHDDLGASLTRITLLSQSARNPGGDATKALQDLDNIYVTARELTKAMDEIVWAVNPHHDTLDSLVTYLGRFAQDFAGAAGIRCRLDVPIQLPAWPLTAEIRHNLFLAVKEALNNALKHSRASEINLTLQLGERSFALSVIDNGVGFDAAAIDSADAPPAPDAGRIASGNGLNNMHKRLEEIGGRCFIVSKPGAGTRITLSVTVP